ncbi:hypothetical protein HO173_012894 [Letharia columbiana]|uniref:Uncharacterized protein n=1 Tax=Letharia columbiana TaxID=112416 RepID=A0A8H6CJC4_9LECA|nr:uncharacterized protein HO173_013088 [Letharia columbiana]XP_037158383.1 uncharacterized protein HO173_012894 [Letharia columbiana]KAF6223886.1 hypothetical protein HO173_013088 [Letharia columbiana]KAF6224685.1 hypothetical protein HO173_012894 [Letharia columbiana]
MTTCSRRPQGTQYGYAIAAHVSSGYVQAGNGQRRWYWQVRTHSITRRNDDEVQGLNLLRGDAVVRVEVLGAN